MMVNATEEKVVRSLAIAIRFPVLSYFKAMSGQWPCPVCGGDLTIRIISVDLEEDGELWLVYEKFCKKCDYDKIVHLKFYPTIEEVVTD